MSERFYVEWSEEALDDLARRLDSMTERSTSASVRAGAAIVDAADNLAAFPNIGRVYPRDPAQRELLVPFGKGGYSLLYRLEGTAILIVGVKHQLEASY